MTNIFLFLDIDGVCNNTINETYFDSYNMANVKTLVDLLKARVVLSSDWRRNPQNMAVARSELLGIGLDIFDTTPILNPPMSFGFRSEEIRKWLSQEEWDRAVIIDDMPKEDVDPKIKSVLFYRTDYHFGLTEEDVDKIIRIYHGNSPIY